MSSHRNGFESRLRAGLHLLTDDQHPPDLADAALGGVRRSARTGLVVAATVVAVAAAVVPTAVVLGNRQESPPAGAADQPRYVVTATCETPYGQPEVRTLEARAPCFVLDVDSGEYVETTFRDVSVSPDGSRVLVAGGGVDGPAVGMVGLQVLARGDLDAIRDLNLTEPQHLQFEGWSPDGQSLLFVRLDRDTFRYSSFFVVDADTGRVGPEHALSAPEAFMLRWAQDGQSLWLLSTGEGDTTTTITGLDLNGTPNGRILTSPRPPGRVEGGGIERVNFSPYDIAGTPDASCSPAQGR